MEPETPRIHAATHRMIRGAIPSFLYYSHLYEIGIADDEIRCWYRLYD
jgi:hypothetical protein